ncbi:MAG TPA: Hsp33 family molecular chaperone HslO [Alphaproteobacteria bacterium]|nr:Hsp33 family molecular chaperone HslO [Alphaproteobacteria bacterium]
MSASDFEDDFSGNIIRPFQLETSSLRGRIVRFNSVLQEILEPHNYPHIVSQLLAETITLCALLSSMLKYDGIFTLQTQGNGPISMLVADVTSDGKIRGCASFDKKRLDIVEKQLAAFSDQIGEGSDNNLAQLLGKGHIAFTVDQGSNTDRYQGIVELKGKSLVDCVQHYFSQSEQIGTGIKLAAGKRDGKWRSAGLMLQHMPEEGGTKGVRDTSNLNEDDWRRSMILMQSCTEEELLSPDLNSHTILLRLFHEEGVRVFPPTKLVHECRCSERKVENVLLMMSEEERDEMIVDGKITLTCEFCSKIYPLDADIVDKKFKELSKASSGHESPPA